MCIYMYICTTYEQTGMVYDISEHVVIHATSIAMYVQMHMDACHAYIPTDHQTRHSNSHANKLTGKDADVYMHACQHATHATDAWT